MNNSFYFLIQKNTHKKTFLLQFFLSNLIFNFLFNISQLPFLIKKKQRHCFYNQLLFTIVKKSLFQIKNLKIPKIRAKYLRSDL